MSALDRTGYAARQTELLDALLRGGDYPSGFAAAQADAAGRSLRRKRAHAVASAWPALAIDLGDALHARFDAFAREADAPDAGDPLRDGLAFARWLGDATPLGDDARVELLLARATLRRRGLFVGVARLRRPYPRVLVVARLPWGRPLSRSLRWREPPPARATPSRRASCRRARAGAARARAGARPCARASRGPSTGP
ncbi:MAG TPA: hypothetical protein VGO81_01930 [Solirubrobacteraceae bacterium]|nr:hypothetical protein [Solirubrobacteraceae bacterium]